MRAASKYVTSRNLRDRLFKEVETNVAMRVEETDSADTFKVSGRGELHLSILIEQMRRQNYEFQVSRPSVIFKEENGKKLEPMELLMIEVPDNYVGAVMEKLGTRKAELLNMVPATAAPRTSNSRSRPAASWATAPSSLRTRTATAS